jgi:hypothetical protein
MNNYTLKTIPGLLPYSGLLSNAILNSVYFNMVNKIQAYLFSEDARLITYVRPSALKVTEQRNA